MQIPCPAGAWSNETQAVSCTNPCDAGYLCSPGSTSPRPATCGGIQYYCPQGTPRPVLVDAGYYTVGGDSDATRVGQSICPSPYDVSSAGNGSGVYCPGDGRVHLCPGGVFGNDTGLSAATCSGVCTAGYYCPPGSSSPEQTPCGDVTR